MGATLAPLKANADMISGTACVTDGARLSIQGRRAYGSCQGGTPIRLARIAAPPLDQICEMPDGQRWDCGRWAAYNLLEVVKGKNLICSGDGTLNGQGEAIMRCQVPWDDDRVDLGGLMVEQGWAINERGGDIYDKEQSAAQEAKVGLWQGRFNHPDDWRQKTKPEK
ncbi:MAG: thermonuclease family protein [Rhodospirillaceae bacterium]